MKNNKNNIKKYFSNLLIDKFMADKYKEGKKDLEYFKNETYYKLVIMFLIIGLIPVCYGAFLFFRENNIIAGTLELLTYVVIFSLFINKRIDTLIKRNILVLSIYLFGLMLLFVAGPSGAGLVVILSSFGIAGCLLDKKRNIVFIFGNLLVFTVISIFINNGFFDNMAINLYRETWYIVTISTLSLGILFMLIIDNIFNNIEKQIDELEKQGKVITESEQRYKSLFEYSGLGIGFYKTDGTIISFNQKAIENMGDTKDYEGRSIYELFPKEEADFYMDRIIKTSKTEKAEEYIDFVSLKSGDKWYSSTLKRISNHLGEVIGIQIISQDVTERINAEIAQKASEEKYQMLFEKMINAFALFEIVSDEDGKPVNYRFLEVNPAFEHMMGLKSQAIINKTIPEVIPEIEPSWIQIYKKVALTGLPVNFENYSKELNKHFGISVYKPRKNQLACVFSDITEQKKSEEQMLHLSYHDQLTGLYNRRFYEEELKRLANIRNLPIALIMMDVNGLKLTNDAFGHQAGDALLKKVADLLKNECRSDEIISRIGGDEFVILLPKTDSENVKKIIQRIEIAVKKESSNNALLSLSIGYAIKDSITKKFDETFKEAEDDMYRHKLSESSSFRSKSIEIIMNSLYEKSSREMKHSKRVSYLCEQIASNLDLNQEEIRECRVAGLVHDIGKIGVSNYILDKDVNLNNEEWSEMKKHSEMGYRILSSVIEFSEIANFVLYHQERWDGKGYPQGLEGEHIPIQSRIIAVADAFDAMTVKRSYRKAMSETEAIAEIIKYAGTQFDPTIAKTFVEKVLGKTW